MRLASSWRPEDDVAGLVQESPNAAEVQLGSGKDACGRLLIRTNVGRTERARLVALGM